MNKMKKNVYVLVVLVVVCGLVFVTFTKSPINISRAEALSLVKDHIRASAPGWDPTAYYNMEEYDLVEDKLTQHYNTFGEVPTNYLPENLANMDAEAFELEWGKCVTNEENFYTCIYRHLTT